MTGDSDPPVADRESNGDEPELVVPTEIRDAICERARDGRPAEICGVLGGSFDPDRSVVRSQYPAENVAENVRTRYRIDPEAQLAIFERLEACGEEIVGFYHSHPRGPSRPSKTDVETATWPDRSYLIVSLAPRSIGSWRWRESSTDERESGRFEPERIEDG
ncbi:desampylase [Natrialbaceae archaeon A-arb3/5]